MEDSDVIDPLLRCMEDPLVGGVGGPLLLLQILGDRLLDIAEGGGGAGLIRCGGGGGGALEGGGGGIEAGGLIRCGGGGGRTEGGRILAGLE